MAHQNGEFMAVNAKQLDKQPKAFQDYVKRYFKRTYFLGIDAYVAILTTGGVNCLRKLEKGVAPSHFVDLNEFTEGLPEGMSLGEWIRTKASKRTRSISVHFASWEDGSISCVFDD